MLFSKYHALGNDYLVIAPSAISSVTAEIIQRLCHRHYGVDGVLLGPLPSTRADVGLRIFNPDGSEAEKSGNGLRIFCRSLWDQGLVQAQSFTVETRGGVVRAEVLDPNRIRIEMGRVSFNSADIPVAGATRQVLQEVITVNGRQFTISAATIGNPYCVINVPDTSVELAQQYGALVEHHSLFPNRTNVQFMQVLDRNAIRIDG